MQVFHVGGRKSTLEPSTAAPNMHISRKLELGLQYGMRAFQRVTNYYAKYPSLDNLILLAISLECLFS